MKTFLSRLDECAQELNELLAVSNDIGIPEHELEQMFHAADEDGDCKVDPKEFVELALRVNS